MKYLLLVLLSVMGCGSVDAMHEDAGGTGGAGGRLDAGGTGGALAGQAGAGVGGAGTGGAAGIPGTAGTGGSTGGTGGAALQPLGATCTTNEQCDAPHLCVAGACCDGHPDACNTCVQGHLKPVADGTICGPTPSGIICTGPYTTAPGNIDVYRSISANACAAGSCGPTTLLCSTQVTCSGGQQPGCRVDILSSGAPQMEGAGCACGS